MRAFWLAGAATQAMASPAPATPFFLAQGGTNSDSAVQCAAPHQSGSSPVRFALRCANPDVGSFSSLAVASFGHLGAFAQAEAHTGFSFASKVETQARFEDQLIFSSSNPAATFADVSPRLLLNGFLDVAASAGAAVAQVDGSLNLNGEGFVLRFTNSAPGGFSIFRNDFNALGVIGPATDAVLTTTPIRVPLNTPVTFGLILSTFAGAGSFAQAGSDFGGSFKFASGDAFDLPDGVTVNAGSWLVDNRFIDPLAAVPEPASWALMMLGFGLLGAGLRARAPLASNRQGEWA
jgi:hypothetical protein